MNIIEENKAIALNKLQQNIKPLQHFCIDVLKIAPNASIPILGREIAKYIAFISLGLNPTAVDIPTDTVINEFLNKTKTLTNFAICQGRNIAKFINTYPELITAIFTVYYTTELSKIKNIDDFLAFDGEEKKSGFKGFFKNLWGGAKQKAKQELGAYAEEKATTALDNFLSWVGNETGIGKAEGNAKNSGGQIYWAWEYFPGGPKNSAVKPEKSDVSANYLEKVWKPALISDGEKDGSGWNFDIEQRALPIYFSKIKAGYYKNHAEWHKAVMADLKKANATEAQKNLKKAIGNEKTNPVKSLISLLTGK